ncbi:MAG TPA: hydroxyacylglutathione hydrolase [Methylophilaceae bacterium]|jgi:hydroxyacylglutathione hydrolase
MIEILPIPAFKDNYIWLVRSGNHAVVIDPGVVTPVVHVLERYGLTLEAILVTHHHHDHIGGVAELLDRHKPEIYAPVGGSYAFPHVAVGDGHRIRLQRSGIEFCVIETPGHTLDHVAYYSQRLQDSPALFCGDTLFSCGCGRLFEGTPQQMYQSLQRLAQLPTNTQVFCAHEYTLDNIAFALDVEPDNAALHSRRQEVTELRARGLPSLPSTLALERATNPFLRCGSVMKALGFAEGSPEVAVFARLREMKNNY